MRRYELDYELELSYARASDDGYRHAPDVIRERVRRENSFFKERGEDEAQKADD